jgi:rubrerythrin
VNNPEASDESERCVKTEQMHELLYQALETEIGGQLVYETAVRCAENDEVREEWEKYLEETRDHERILRDAFQRLDLDADAASPGREVLKIKAKALVQAMESALEAGGKPMAQLVAAESIVEAETKDHQNWELIGRIVEEADGELSTVLKEAYDQVEEQEDEHLYHTMGWARELWIDSLGLPAVLPPPEEEKDVRTAIGAARAEQQREDML